MKTNYSEAFAEQVVIKLLSRGKRTIREIARELNVNHHTARNWVKKDAANKELSPLWQKKSARRTGVLRSNCRPCRKPTRSPVKRWRKRGNCAA